MRFVRSELSIPWIVSVTDIATSAAFYVAVEGDRLVVTESAMLGGLGTSINLWDAGDFLHNIGIIRNNITSSPAKNTFGLFDPINSLKIDSASDFCRSVTSTFIEHLSGRREILDSARPTVEGGEIFDGRFAFTNGVADRIGSMLTSIQEVAMLASLTTLPKMILIDISKGGAGKRRRSMIVSGLLKLIEVI